MSPKLGNCETGENFQVLVQVTYIMKFEIFYLFGTLLQLGLKLSHAGSRQSMASHQQATVETFSSICV